MTDDATSTDAPQPEAPERTTTPRRLPVTDVSLVVLIGTSGSGKSTFARRHFLPTQVISSDFCRGLVADDDNDQSASAEAFDVLHYIVGKRLAAGRLTVVDATNVQPEARRQLVAIAREHDVLPIAIVLDVPPGVCAERNRSRPDRQLPAHVVPRQHRELRRSLRGLEREGFRKVHVLRGEAEVAAAEIELEKRYNDLRHLTGPFDIVGDIHGCRSELETLLDRLGYTLARDAEGRPVDAAHPAGRTAVFVGDLVDRGPDTPGVLRLVMGMVAAGHALCVPGNHENKLGRAMDGKKVTVSHGLQESLDQLAGESEEFKAEVRAFMRGLVSHYLLDGGALVVCHAGLPERYHGRASGRVRSHALYGETTGETDEYGLPVRYPWAEEYRGRALVVYGHTPVPSASFLNNTICLDTGCVFGGSLTALRYPERELVSVEAEREWYAPVRPLLADAPGAREGRPLDLADVAGRRIVETGLHGRVAVREENATAALEVMSRFALDPRLLAYLPPTMAPSPTSRREGYLEHPEEAFFAYRADGVRHLVCEEKHMGSRAVLLVARDGAALERRFGVAGPGAIWTRTGRAFLDDEELTAAVLGRVRSAAERAGLFEELGTDWLLLDAELMPWSLKAVELLRRQYAAVGAAAGAALPEVLSALEQAAARGLELGELTARQRRRAADARAFTESYRRYCWPTEGLSGLRLAPFQLLAAEGANLAARPHDEHLAWVDRLVDADEAAAAEDGDARQPVLHRTGRVLVDTEDEASVAAATAWWEDLTAAGGEGMVVKPLASVVRTARGEGRPGGLVQPGLKVRGREYLRIIYGPDYTEHLDRLRMRSLGHKRSLALREYALGLEALDRLAAGEPLWRVHEPVFAVLALESEPVDPRL
ncbi:polynucleotide kinase-phosphatase [Kitasatospora cathayae]|uniref:Polynucleotide kinase-phosphatase n=1 Tax=Kitasatospora cathayae TaxID=3004092 RepID=A0ABY7Q884_9ACTN|nr:polynucleotide kinase-phosphatase [Kitasatospora sp. HUAS 3-15]WBP88853.1 polynucleotide kinase-phosphatase [Kitasatospora sp. HUAS 3-15]